MLLSAAGDGSWRRWRYDEQIPGTHSQHLRRELLAFNLFVLAVVNCCEIVSSGEGSSAATVCSIATIKFLKMLPKITNTKCKRRVILALALACSRPEFLMNVHVQCLSVIDANVYVSEECRRGAVVHERLLRHTDHGVRWHIRLL